MKYQIFGLISFAMCCISFMSCSNDNEGISFSQDELIGDIATGKQEGIKNNSVTLGVGLGKIIHINGASGDCTAHSADANIVTSTVVKGSPMNLIINSINMGNTTVTVTDANGNTAQLMVEVNAKVNQYILRIVSFTVEGVNKADSIAIVNDLQNRYGSLSRLCLEYLTSNKGNARLYTSNDKIGFEGSFFIADNEDGVFDISLVDLKTYTLWTKFHYERGALTIDSTKYYLPLYPSVKKVQVVERASLLWG
jgi:hypothetical protein